MILPIGHGHGAALRWPVVTLGVATLCILVYLWQRPALESHAPKADAAYNAALLYCDQHPYLEPDPRLLPGWTAPDPGASRSVLPVVRRAQEAQLDELTRAWLDAEAASPRRRYGVSPVDASLHRFLTYPFLHLGMLSLFGSLLFLYLGGAPLEDVWGRPLFATLLLLSVVVAAATHVSMSPEEAPPMVGAAGAVAAVMGAFLVRFWSLRLDFVTFDWIFGGGRFSAPAWFMLPLWLGAELWSLGAESGVALATSDATPPLVRIGSFLFGVAFAVVVGLTKVEERYIGPRIREKAGLTYKPHLDRVGAAQHTGPGGEGSWSAAKRQIEEELRRRPEDLDLQRSLWNLAVDHGRTADVLATMIRFVQLRLRSWNEEWAFRLLRDLRHYHPDLPVEAGLKLGLLEDLLAGGHRQEAEHLGQVLAREADTLAPALVLRLARDARRFDPLLASRVAEAGLRRDDMTDLRRELEPLLSSVTAVASDRGSESGRGRR